MAIKCLYNCLDTMRSSEGTELFDIVNAYLQTGSNPGALDAGRELQQELVHFSRIADVETLFVGGTAGRRLHRSSRLPLSLKFLSELAVVFRSRLRQRGTSLTPVERRRPEVHDLAPGMRVLRWSGTIAILSATRRRSLTQITFLLGELISYLPPSEAINVLMGYAIGDDVFGGLTIDYVESTRAGNARAIIWRRPDTTGLDPIESVISVLPRVIDITPHDRSSLLPISCNYEVSFEPSESNGSVRIHNRTFLITPYRDCIPPPQQIVVAGAIDLLSRFQGVEFVSLECAHIHLNRRIDHDQHLGAAIGLAIHDHLRARSFPAPMIMPLIDDDHVMIDLRPHEYRTFLDQALDGLSYRLIPESSPIVRAIACATLRFYTDESMQGRSNAGGGATIAG